MSYGCAEFSIFEVSTSATAINHECFFLFLETFTEGTQS